ncbi:hypothetical protein NECAME_03296 [Necator americanus]|uniref:Uncharacterized protein n=1 Tax=Necator americanus TaxID=51031 RepID=W2T7Q6_NECAM|nr:hypothetical protein NECAME_03296 [Necator americanus]ETN77196.1 hypothetical protein NECAME_03296 [Necator americanus]
MQSLIVLTALLAVALGKAVRPRKIVTATSGYAYAVDLAVPVPVSAFTCLKNSGYSAVFVRGYDPASAGKFDTNAVNSIRNAKKAGLECEVFMTPQPRSVTSSINWNRDTKANIDFLRDILSMAKYYGVAIGFYTNVHDWTQITNGATAEGTMLW